MDANDLGYTLMAGDNPQTRILIQLSEADTRLLTLWAKVHGRPRSTFAAQIVASRVEANLDIIKKQVAEYASAKGISVNELESQWLGDDDDE